MKKEIQPNYVEVKFVCACGSEFAGKTSKPGVKENDIVLTLGAGTVTNIGPMIVE